jgi:hypothetical protein
MATATKIMVRKHFRLDGKKLRRVRELFGVSTDTEAVNRALDFAIEEHKRNRIVAEAHREFVESSIVIRDVFGRLD